jgi:hypothetical protein
VYSSLPVLIAATIRTGEPDSDELLLGEIGQDPATVVVQPRPLTAVGTAGLVSELLGDADEAFAAACQEVTAGNPLLLRQLLTVLAAEHVVPDAEHAASVRAVGPRAVSRTVRLRLARLPEPAPAVARAVAVLGEQPGLPAIAALAGVEEGVAAETIDALVRAEILRALASCIPWFGTRSTSSCRRRGAAWSTSVPRACWPSSAPRRSGSPLS